MARLTAEHAAGRKPVLLYRATCCKCRVLSLLAIAVSGGRIRRLPNDDPTAEALMADRGLLRTRVLLVDADSAARGWGAVPGLLRAILRIGWSGRSR